MRVFTSCAALMLASTLSGCASTSSAPYSPIGDPVAQQLARQNPQALNIYLSAREKAQEESDFAIPWRKVLNVSVAIIAYHNPVMGLSPSASAFMAMTNGPDLLDEENKEDSMPSNRQDLTAMLMAQGQQHLQQRIDELEAQLASSLSPSVDPSQDIASALNDQLGLQHMVDNESLPPEIRERITDVTDQWLANTPLTFDTLIPEITVMDRPMVDNETSGSSLLAEEIALSVGSLWTHPRHQPIPTYP